MTIRQLSLLKSLRTRFPAEIHCATAGDRRTANLRGSTVSAMRYDQSRMPTRPDSTILSASIPLYFIGRNHNGIWVSREANGRSGGMFLFRTNALRFARKKSARAGVATMLVSEPLELDIANEGSRTAEALSAALDTVSRRAPTFMTFIWMAGTEWRKLVAQLSRALAGEKRNRAAIEQELFRGQYTLSSKSDDDLPIVP